MLPYREKQANLGVTVPKLPVVNRTVLLGGNTLTLEMWPCDD